MQSRYEKQQEAIRATAVTVKVLDFRIAPRAIDGDPAAVSNVELVKQPKDQKPFPKRFKIVTLGGDEGANCGYASLLFEAASSSKLITATISGNPKTKTYSINWCGGYYKLHKFCSAIAGCDGVNDEREGGTAAPMTASERGLFEEKLKRNEKSSE
ncbi:hypothetical protein PY365_05250 [Roseiarcaceae bacterium H3SJ34-1]|uniref:hypothetical protein n=1 Tax=Terripilifer ovatus TaxID=3032367 RepID=UPI003AB94A87|nr:hypothetical protein [Roseiarcaceae bacterium H3SJ34-1]